MLCYAEKTLEEQDSSYLVKGNGKLEKLHKIVSKMLSQHYNLKELHYIGGPRRSTVQLRCS